MSQQLEKFKSLLSEMFQFDQADLDFGIYRIMNQKRKEIEKFLDEDLLSQVSKAFEKYKAIGTSEIQKQLEELGRTLDEMEVVKETNTKYLALQKKLSSSVDISTLENEVFSDLTNFFNRYYDEGDFISKRRYKRDVYAIPYEGEEVKLHWANADQYYVKTSEQFKDYTFTLESGKVVHFKLIEASTEKNNNKEQSDKERRFVLNEEKPLIEENDELIIHFEYTIPEPKKRQDALNKLIVENLSKLLVDEPRWRELLTIVPSEKNKNRTLLEKHLYSYTAKNTFDYFIHKDLEGFLKRELDFFIKNEVMYLDDIDTENEISFEAYLSKIKVLKNIAIKIINFLSQIEKFQKKLYLKKKFIVSTDYCITLDLIPEDLYEEILNNENQINEWIKLFAIDKISQTLTSAGFSVPLTIDFLRENRNLLLDTHHFSTKFKNRLLRSLDDIDNKLNGTLFNTDNFQGLNLIKDKFDNKISYIYIDPPYNAKSSEILYKNTFKHSSWLSMMDARIKLAKGLLSSKAVMTVAIDENELENLGILLSQNMANYDKTIVSVIHNPAGIQGQNFSYSHESAIFMYPKNGEFIGYTEREDELVSPLRDWGGTSARKLAKTCFYPIIVRGNEIVDVGEVCQEDYHPESSNIEKDGLIYIYPVDKNNIERKWVFNQESVRNNLDQLFVKEQDGEKVIMRRKSVRKYRTVWEDKKYYANIYGSKLLSHMFGKQPFSFPKSIHTVEDSIKAAISANENDSIVLDFFAGSGTTGHAVINLNKIDGKKRKYFLMEMGSYFETVTLPRIKKAVYCSEWKSGAPLKRDGDSHFLKYSTLESYEDALNNIELKQSEQQKLALNEHMSDNAKEEYMLSYMLENEASGSASLLNIDAFNNPFDYKMKISNGNETKIQPVDLVETFNYLLGLYVESYDFFKGCQFVKGHFDNGENILIIWRNVDEVSNEMLNKILEQWDINSLENEFSCIYVNGDNHIENLKIVGSSWEVALIEEEFKRLMFNIQDI